MNNTNPFQNSQVTESNPFGASSKSATDLSGSALIANNLVTSLDPRGFGREALTGVVESQVSFRRSI